MENLVERIRIINRKIHDWLRRMRLCVGKSIFDSKENKRKIKDWDIIKNYNIKSILINRDDGKVGDMVVSTILFREIKRNYPNIKIGVIARNGAMEIIKNNKNINYKYVYRKDIRSILDLAREIKIHQYDLLIDFSLALKVKQMFFISKCCCKYNMGIDKKNWNMFDFNIDNIDYNKHISFLYSSILNKLGIQSPILEYDIDFSDCRIEKNLMKSKYGVFNPYAASKNRSLNFENIIKIITLALKNMDISVVIIGTQEHKEEMEKIKKIINNERVFFKNNLTINELITVVKNADFVITPDTSIVHIAAAFKINSICIYRKPLNEIDNNSIFWGPNNKNARVIYVEQKIENGEEININNLKFENLEKEIKRLGSKI